MDFHIHSWRNSLNAPTTATTKTTTTTLAHLIRCQWRGTVDSEMLMPSSPLSSTAQRMPNTMSTAMACRCLGCQTVNANLDASAPGAPIRLGTQLSAVQRDRLQQQIDLLIATGDQSPPAMRTLVYLQQLIAMARPEKTQLLANYPNPFNPETWIPYDLAAPTDVRVTIYDVQGRVVRALDLGHQAAGVYQSRSRAAYWDGRNAVGEPVASGLYFYTLTAGNFSATRKMLIRK